MPNSPEGRREYERRKANGTLFDVRGIQLALSEIPIIFVQVATRKEARARHKRFGAVSAGVLKHLMEGYRAATSCQAQFMSEPHGYMPRGDFSIAMLLSGYPIRKHPGLRGCELSFTCMNLMEYVVYEKNGAYTSYVLKTWPEPAYYHPYGPQPNPLCSSFARCYLHQNE